MSLSLTLPSSVEYILELGSNCRILEAMPASEVDSLPLWGIPFAVKDNIDVQGFVTTAACREFSERKASDSAPAVQVLLDAGIPIHSEMALGSCQASSETTKDSWSFLNLQSSVLTSLCSDDSAVWFSFLYGI